MSMMRTHALPAIWTTNGSTQRAMPAIRKAISFCWRGASANRVMAWRSGAIGDALAEQALRAQREHQDEHDEGEDVLVVAAENAAGEVADVAGTERLDQAEQDAADHRTGEVADAAEDGSGERLQPRQEAHRV